MVAYLLLTRRHLDMANPEANARSVGPNVDRRVEPTECHRLFAKIEGNE